jgi:hypothetical protein
MKKYLTISNGVIGLLTIICVLSIINPNGIMPNRTVYVPKIDSIQYTIHDTIFVDSLVEVEVPIEIMVEIDKPVPMYQAVDTATILKDFNTKNELKETITLPNNLGHIDFIGLIYQNKLMTKSFEPHVKQKVVKDTIYTPIPKKNIIYAGFTGGYNRIDVIPNMSLGIMLKTKGDKIFQLGAGVTNRVSEDGLSGNFTPFISGGVYWKVSK